MNITEIHMIETLLFYITIINFIIVFPIFFKTYLIPKIEKRFTEKLQYKMVIYQVQIFSEWFIPPFEIAFVIVIKYLILKITKKPPGKIWGFNLKSPFAISLIHYDIEQAPAIEIIASFLVIFNSLMFVAVMCCM